MIFVCILVHEVGGGVPSLRNSDLGGGVVMPFPLDGLFGE